MHLPKKKPYRVYNQRAMYRGKLHCDICEVVEGVVKGGETVIADFAHTSQ